VILFALVSEAGLPLEIKVIRGVRQDLDAAAVTAIRKWTFEAGRRNGREVRAWATIQVSFEP
jgi:TonB family protein